MAEVEHTQLARVVIEPKPEHILTSREAALIQKSDRDQLQCVRCNGPLLAAKIMSEVYQGVVMACFSGCGWREY